MHWLKTSLIAVAALVVALLSVGFVYEQIGRTRDAHTLPPRIGRAVDIGGRTLNLFCSGTGAPAVIFESGAGGVGYDWVLVQSRVAAFTQACWYDRAGEGWSDPPTSPNTSTSVANDLQQLLQGAGVSPPYVLVGASIGGEYVRVFTARYPDEVAGIVFVDAGSPEQNEPPSMLSPINRMSLRMRRLLCYALPALERFGLLRLLEGGRTFAPNAFSREERRTYVALQSRFRTTDADQMCRAYELASPQPDIVGTGDPELDAAARKSGTLGNRPVVVLTAGQYIRTGDPVGDARIAAFHEVWVNRLQANLARLSNRGRQIVVENSGHAIEFEAPGAVVGAVRDVVEQVRGR